MPRVRSFTDRAWPPPPPRERTFARVRLPASTARRARAEDALELILRLMRFRSTATSAFRAVAARAPCAPLAERSSAARSVVVGISSQLAERGGDLRPPRFGCATLAFFFFFLLFFAFTGSGSGSGSGCSSATSSSSSSSSSLPRSSANAFAGLAGRPRTRRKTRSRPRKPPPPPGSARRPARVSSRGTPWYRRAAAGNAFPESHAMGRPSSVRLGLLLVAGPGRGEMCAAGLFDGRIKRNRRGG